jgi:hypothetical protein
LASFRADRILARHLGAAVALMDENKRESVERY